MQARAACLPAACGRVGGRRALKVQARHCLVWRCCLIWIRERCQTREARGEERGCRRCGRHS